MNSILLINPNTSDATTAMMISVVRPLLPTGLRIRGICAAHGVAMIVNEADLSIAADEVVRIGMQEVTGADAIVIAAFGNPGALRLRARLTIPVIGIGEAAIMEAAAGNRRFGIATTTPQLVGAIEAGVRQLALERNFTGVRVSEGDPLVLASSPDEQDVALGKATIACIELDGADAVVIGGGPLSETAMRLRQRFANDIIEPVPAAIRYLLAQPARKF